MRLMQRAKIFRLISVKKVFRSVLKLSLQARKFARPSSESSDKDVENGYE